MTGRSAVVLAAGKGTRFESDQAKVLHHLCGKPLIAHVLDALTPLRLDRLIVVVGYQSGQVREALGNNPIHFVEQKEQLGTGHAVASAAGEIEQVTGSVLVLYGDTPLIRTATLERLIETRQSEQADQCLLTCHLEDPTGYGRIIRDDDGHPVDIIEEEDTSDEQRQIREVNPGFYCYRAESLLAALEALSDDNAQREFYLTDTVSILSRRGGRVRSVSTGDTIETTGINDRIQLAEVEQILRRRITRQWMRRGVSMVDPASTWIDAEVTIGRDTVLHPGVQLLGRTSLGKGCIVSGWCTIENSTLAEEVRVDHCSVIRDSSVGKGTTIGPFAHLRANSRVGSGARVGNFVEVKDSRLEDGVKSAHLSYLGNSTVGTGSNIGAGVITCNYDGEKKHQTKIGERVFVGSDSQLIAPVSIGSDAYIAAGSTITDDVPDEALGIARSRQTVKEKWVAEKKRKKDG